LAATTRSERQVATSLIGNIADIEVPPPYVRFRGGMADIAEFDVMSAYDPSDVDPPYLEMALGFEELLYFERIASRALKNRKKLAMPLVSAAQRSLTKWLAIIAENDFHDLPSIIAVEAVFRSPVGLKPYPGRDLVCLMLSTAADIFEDFKYHRVFLDGENAALEFSARIGDIELKAVHLARRRPPPSVTGRRHHP
jgi:hypothetical protein